MIVLNDNNLEFINEHINLFNEDDLISIVYNQIGDKIYPYIGLQSILGDKGYKLTKSHTILLKGKNNKFLSTFGTNFNIEKESENIYKLISLNEPEDLKDDNLKKTIYEINLQEEILDIDDFVINFINI